MTATTERTVTGRLLVYDQVGQVIATVGASRSRWRDWLLAECDDHHIYLVDPDDPWVGCPVCEELE